MIIISSTESEMFTTYDLRPGKVMECVTSLDAAEGDEDLYTYKIQLTESSQILNDISHTKIE